MSVVRQTLIRTSRVKGHAKNVQQRNRHLEKQEWQAIPIAQVWHWTKWRKWNRHNVNQRVYRSKDLFTTSSHSVFTLSKSAPPIFSWFIFYFTDTNPLQLSDQVVYLPYDIKSETLVTNVTVTGRLESLVQPLLFYMENVTQQQLSRSESKRKRRDIDDFCEGAGTVKPMSYFCVHRLTGGIEVTDDFQFKNGDKFDVKIRVTDSDQWGKTEKTAKIRFISRDLCRNLRAIYDVAVKNCINNSSSVTRQNWCLSEHCVKFGHRWKEALNNTSRVTSQTNCSFDPHNLAAVMREHPSCPGDIGIGRSRVILISNLVPSFL